MKIKIETSARHIHLSQEHLDKLFGKGYELTIKKELSQPGQFACNEKVTVKGPKGEIPNISILGPIRKTTQIELSLTDARKIGITAPIRESGDIENTPGCTIIGPNGNITVENGIIAAKRHIHLDSKTASENDLLDEQIVKVKVNSNDRSLIFDDVVVRVNDKYYPAMHIDTDESNAADLSNPQGEIII